MKELLIKYKLDHPNDLVIKDQLLKNELQQIFEGIDNPKIAAAMIIVGITEQPKCYCGNKLEFLGQAKSEVHVTPYGGWRKYCSRKCMYASPETDLKRKATSMKNHGVEHYSKIQVFEPKWSDEKKRVFKERSIATAQKNWGVDHHSMTPEYLIKREATCVERYDVTNTFLLPKVKETMIARHGVDSWLKSPAADISRRTRVITSDEKLKSYITFITNKLVDKELCEILITKDSEKFQTYIKNIVDVNGFYCRPQIAKHIGLSTSHTNKLFRRFGMQEDYLITKGRSFAESQITEFLTTLGVEYIVADRTVLNGKELDVYIPAHQFAIEYDGDYFHSNANGKSPTYHLEKTLVCETNSIQLFHIFESEWMTPHKRIIWESMIRNKLSKIDKKIGARQCEFVEITSIAARKFLDNNHLNGFRNAEHHYGLLFNNELVSVMSIGKSYFNKNTNEIVRFASLVNTNIIGGLSKMLSKIDTTNLITYADRRISSPLKNAYSKFFSKITTTVPNWYGVEPGYELRHRLSYTKHKLMSRLGDAYDNSKSVQENMTNAKIYIIHDCGNLKFSNAK